MAKAALQRAARLWPNTLYQQRLSARTKRVVLSTVSKAAAEDNACGSASAAEGSACFESFQQARSRFSLPSRFQQDRPKSKANRCLERFQRKRSKAKKAQPVVKKGNSLIIRGMMPVFIKGRLKSPARPPVAKKGPVEEKAEPVVKKGPPVAKKMSQAPWPKVHPSLSALAKAGLPLLPPVGGAAFAAFAATSFAANGEAPYEPSAAARSAAS